MGRLLHLRRAREAYGCFMCAFPDCDRDSRYGGYCNTHYHQQRRSGEMWPIGSPRSFSRTKGARQATECAHPGCGGDPVALGLCRAHYGQQRRHGETWDLRPGGRSGRPLPPMPECSLVHCSERQRRGDSGYCAKHAQANAVHLRKYGISLLERQALSEAQGNCCAMCRQPRTLHLDHCHDTGKVRGLLCGNCNRAIGLLAHDPEVLAAGVRYLQ